MDTGPMMRMTLDEMDAAVRIDRLRADYEAAARKAHEALQVAREADEAAMEAEARARAAGEVWGKATEAATHALVAYRNAVTGADPEVDDRYWPQYGKMDLSRLDYGSREARAGTWRERAHELWNLSFTGEPFLRLTLVTAIVILAGFLIVDAIARLTFGIPAYGVGQP